MPKIGKDLLSDVSIKTAKTKDKTYSLRDGGGLWLVIEPTGKKWWKLKTVFVKKENSFSLGEYPTVTLSLAREQRNGIRKQIATGIDPAVSRKSEKAKAAGDGTFEAVAREWHNRFKNKWTVGHAESIMTRLGKDVFPFIGIRPMNEITPPEMLAVIRRIESRTLETAHRAKITCGQVYRYAIAIGKATHNPVDALRGALPPVKPKHMAAPTDPKEVAPLLRMIAGYDGSFVVACALRLAPLVFVRPGELRHAEWAAIDLDSAEWRYMATKTKAEHLVPLSRQAVEILREVHDLTGSGRYVFPSARSASRPMSDNTINAALRRMGIDTKLELTGHGFRAMARTILDEVLGFRPELIEHQLAHAVRDPLGRAYNRTTYLPERKAMMQAWADYLDKIKIGAEIIPIRDAG
ncbi:tyrosine-type recombinase/integrase [Thiovibrio frasassiensis]|uniref:Integrase arm-type DNA-binding domain-containing protein n=1 Tax=Thiovibrio frasassiensis TaxID=2984131 RepID=A0A9X4MHI8_9BACT|nr:integrase arm-type DNA-binding domain-containing protein [Thiovibrio frasassiensis]MDG4475648.1 integrase arm-type DNA-binding domain-containing protein [Thiovibrio frasassiensis]